MLKSDNGWVCLNADSTLLRSWTVGPVELVLRNGAAGFLLAHLATWFDEEIERLNPFDMPDYDDHGYGIRYIGGGVQGVPSNHWSATAIDLNAKRHPQGFPTVYSFTEEQARKIRRKLKVKYPGIVWGGDWNAVDSMHFEFDEIDDFSKEDAKALALSLVDTPIGQRVIAAQDKPVLYKKW